jgi:molecular chaperone GrpE
MTNKDNAEGTPADPIEEILPPEEVAEEAPAEQEQEPNYQLVINDLNDKVLRAAAEVQNIRRRAEQDIQKARQFSIESFAKDLLGVMDNLCRAADSVSEEDAVQDEKLKAIRDGVEITKKEMLNVFERNQIKCINPLGNKFDHNFHQAMNQIEDAEKESGTIINVMQTGYTIKNRLIRPALVVVTK